MGWGGRTWHHLARFWPELGFPWDLGSRGKAATWPPPRGPPHWHPMFPPSFTQTLVSRQGLTDSLATRPLQHRCALRWSLSCESPRAVLSSHRFGVPEKKTNKRPIRQACWLCCALHFGCRGREAARGLAPCFQLLLAACTLPAPAARAVPTSPQSISIQQPPGERLGRCQPAPRPALSPWPSPTRPCLLSAPAPQLASPGSYSASVDSSLLSLP